MSSNHSFYSQVKVLIADSTIGSRVAIRQSLMELGVSANRIQCVKTLAEAKSAMLESSPSLVIADYKLSDGLSTELLKMNIKILFLLLSSNNSKAAIGKAVEEEVDSFLFKPYCLNDFKSAIESLAKKWKNPDPFEEHLAEGSKLLDSGLIDEAEARFICARDNPKTRTRACAYLGQIEKIRQNYPSAERSFEEGLKNNQTHFRCLLGLHETYYQQQRYEDAYRVLKELVTHFPESPERLVSAVNLAVRTEEVKDIETYYNVFNLLTQQTEESIRYLCSALSVVGHYYLKRKNMVQAMLSFERALVVSRKDEKYVNYIRQKMSDLGLEKELDRLLTKNEAA